MLETKEWSRSNEDRSRRQSAVKTKLKTKSKTKIKMRRMATAFRKKSVSNIQWQAKRHKRKIARKKWIKRYLIPTCFAFHLTFFVYFGITPPAGRSHYLSTRIRLKKRQWIIAIYMRDYCRLSFCPFVNNHVRLEHYSEIGMLDLLHENGSLIKTSGRSRWFIEFLTSLLANISLKQYLKWKKGCEQKAEKEREWKKMKKYENQGKI